MDSDSARKRGNMSEEQKDKMEGTKEGNISRRNFLKDAGLAIGAPAIGSMVVSSDAMAQAKVEKKASGIAESVTGKPASDLTPVELTVNGGKYRFMVEPHWSLRQLLRDHIGFTSPKDWCGGQGACGSCTVIMNGRPVLSCMTLACECNGVVIETAEGIAKAKHPVIQAYINNNAFQCGYCTPGFVCTAKALLDKNKKPTEADVRDALGGNLCRCGTYQQHPLAVLEAAANLK
jgi:aerobic-type carbon monoxide dehydrogenase small subunit (CoxS/CutS family)